MNQGSLMGFDIHIFLNDVAVGNAFSFQGKKSALPKKGGLITEETKQLILEAIQANKASISEQDLESLHIIRGKICPSSSSLPTSTIGHLFKESFGLNLGKIEIDLIKRHLKTKDKHAIINFIERHKDLLKGLITEESIVAIWREIKDDLQKEYKDLILSTFISCIEGKPWLRAKEILRDAPDDVRRDFLLACAQINDYGTLQNLKNFGITDQKDLIAIAKHCAQNNGWLTAQYIKNFDITDHSALIDIAKLCAQNSGAGTAQQIKNFDITDHSALIDIAKLCAQNNGKTAVYIQNFGITDQRDLIDIATLCAQNDGGATAEEIHNFGITDQSALFDIAKICAQNNSWSTAEEIHNFGITDQSALIEIAILCAQNNGRGTAQCIQNFGIINLESKKQILLIALKNNPNAIEYWSSAGFDGEENLSQLFSIPTEKTPSIIRKYIGKHLSKTTFEQLLSEIEAQEIPESDLKELSNEEINEKKKELQHKKAQQLLWLGPALFLIRQSCSDDDIAWIEKHQFLKTLSSMTRPDLRWPFTAALTEVAANPAARTVCERLPTPKNMQNNLLYTLTKLFCAQLIAEGVEEKEVFNLLEIVGCRSHGLFRDSRTHLHLAESIFRLAQEKNLTAKEKTAVLKSTLTLRIDKITQEATRKYLALCASGEKITDKQVQQLLIDIPFSSEKERRGLKTRLTLAANDKKKPTKEKVDTFHVELSQQPKVAEEREAQLLLNLQSLNSILLFQNSEFLKDDAIGLGEALEKSFRSKVPMDDMENFSEKYFKTFGSSRNPMAIMTYASKIASLNHEEASKCLGKYVTSVLDGKLEKVRNSLENNPHLQQINSSDPEVLKKWQKSATIPLDILVLSEEAAQFSTVDWLNQKLLADNNLGDLQSLCPDLCKYLSANLEERKIIQEAFVKKKKESLGKIEESEKVLFDVQETCMEIVILKTKDLMGKLKRLETLLEKEPFNSPKFLNDAKDLQEQLRKPKSTVRPSEYVAMDSEDFMDILLAGTEAAGSCQQIDGDPFLNRGLLGCLLDGKTRVLAIKTKEGPQSQMKARCLLRLLWDGGQPVLLRERLYPSHIDPAFEKALNALAEKKAKELGVPLVSKDGKGALYPKTLHALGGPAPYEYVDAAGGVQLQGQYTVTGVRFVAAAAAL